MAEDSYRQAVHSRSANLDLDEPTSALDAETKVEVFELLKRECADRCVLVVTHRASTLVHVDNIVVMDAGQIVQRGSFDELLASPGRFLEMFQNQIDDVRKMLGGVDLGQAEQTKTGQHQASQSKVQFR